MIRPTTLPAELDGLRLRAKLAELTANGWEDLPARAKAIEVLKDYLAKGRALAASRIEGHKGGLAAARTLSDVMNAMMRALYDSIALDHTDDGARAPGVVLCALGGYGAGELAPNSDIDLLFLTPKKAPGFTSTVVERVLYALWDCGLSVGGGAVRTVDEALKLAKNDVSERTALLDVRYITGDISVLRSLMTRFDKELVRPHAVKFASAKLAERDERVDRQGDSRYAVEPNVKDGKGGLRDLQTLRWLAQVLYGDDALERWVGDGLLSYPDVERFLDAADFLWTTRFHLHNVVGSKDDRLTFDVQPEIARAMGFTDGEAHLGVEAFMREYFLKAIDVGALTRLVCAKLEADHFKDPPGDVGRFMPSDGTQHIHGLADAGLRINAGRLDFTQDTDLAANPLLMLRLFEFAAARQFDLHPDAVAKIGQSLDLIDDDFRADLRAARSFFAILLDADDPRMTLRAMTEAGVLGAYIPEFGDIVARTQFNMYHRFTVDEHTLNALGWLREMEAGQHGDEHPLITELTQDINQRRALHLAVLLHDTGKGKGDQCIEGEKNAFSACKRLGLDDSETELVAWLIRHHMDMSETAQRRDVGDPATVHDFAEFVGTRERLALLSILTVVDIRAVGPGIWNGWKGQLLRDLHTATMALLDEKGQTLNAAASRKRLESRSNSARHAFKKGMGSTDPEFAERWVEQLQSNYWLSFTRADRLRHGQFAREAQNTTGEIHVGIHIDKRFASTEVLVYAPDRLGLFADIAAAMALEGANVLGAHINTTKSGHAFDVFYVHEDSGEPFGIADDMALARLGNAVEQAARGGLPDDLVIAPKMLKRREAAFKIEPKVKFIDDATDQALVIEASGRDRFGLMYALANTLNAHGLGLTGARIDGYGERAVDTFFVTRQGQKPSMDHALETVREDLLKCLQQAEDLAEAKRAASNLVGANESGVL